MATGNKRKWATELITKIVGNSTTADMVIEVLENEGLLVLGYGNADIDAIITRFKDVFGTTKATKYDRWAANRLAEKYGQQAVVGIIGLLGGLSTEKYAPVVNSVSELETKWASILNFLRKAKGDEEIDV